MSTFGYGCPPDLGWLFGAAALLVTSLKATLVAPGRRDQVRPRWPANQCADDAVSRLSLPRSFVGPRTCRGSRAGNRERSLAFRPILSLESVTLSFLPRERSWSPKAST